MDWKQLTAYFNGNITETLRLVQLFDRLKELILLSRLQNHVAFDLHIEIASPFTFQSAIPLKHSALC